MSKQIKISPKNQGGEQAAGDDLRVTAQFPAKLVVEVEAWARKNEATRSEAIRRLVEIGLTVKVARQKNQSQKDRAREMAAGIIDTMSDSDATADDQASRKRRLLKGPEEFRDVRVDRKAKK